MLTPCLGGGTIKSLNVNRWAPPQMQQQSVFRYTFQAKHLRTRPRKTTDIFVSAGSFSDPYYTFADKKGRTIKSFELDPSKQYRFKRADKASTHPFYISDRGWNQPATKKIKIKGDGNFNKGIIDSEKFTLSIKKKHQKQFATSGRLFFYCTSHQSMVGEIIINPGKKSSRQSASEQQLNQPVSANAIKSHSTFSTSYSTLFNTSEPWSAENSLLNSSGTNMASTKSF